MSKKQSEMLQKQRKGKSRKESVPNREERKEEKRHSFASLLVRLRGVRVVLLEVFDAAGGCLILVGLVSLLAAGLTRCFRLRVLGSHEKAFQELLVVLSPPPHRQLRDLDLWTIASHQQKSECKTRSRRDDKHPHPTGIRCYGIHTLSSYMASVWLRQVLNFTVSCTSRSPSCQPWLVHDTELNARPNEKGIAAGYTYISPLPVWPYTAAAPHRGVIDALHDTPARKASVDALFAYLGLTS